MLQPLDRRAIRADHACNPIMNWPTIIWSMAAATSLTLASIHLLFWLRAHEARASLVFSVAAVAAAAVAILE